MVVIMSSNKRLMRPVIWSLEEFNLPVIKICWLSIQLMLLNGPLDAARSLKTRSETTWWWWGGGYQECELARSPRNPTHCAVQAPAILAAPSLAWRHQRITWRHSSRFEWGWRGVNGPFSLQSRGSYHRPSSTFPHHVVLIYSKTRQ